MKNLILIALAFTTMLNAGTVIQTVPAMYDKADRYPTTAKGAINVIMSMRGCLLKKDERLNKLDSSFSMIKVTSNTTTCRGWIPKEFYRY